MLRFAVFVLALSTVALGDTEGTEAEARTLAWRALDLEKQGACSEAIPLFRRAYNLVPAATLALFEGRCRERIGQLLEAETRYEAAASFTPSAASPPAIKNAVSEAKERLVALRPRIPHIVLTNRTTGTRVWLDGRETSGSTLSVNPGDHDIEWGDRSQALRVRVSEGTDQRVRLTESSSARDIGTYAALGIGALGIGTGIVTGFMAADKKSDLNDECNADRCPPSSRGTLDDYRSLRSVSFWSYAVGVVGLGVGGVLLVTKPAPEPAIVASGTF